MFQLTRDGVNDYITTNPDRAKEIADFLFTMQHEIVVITDLTTHKVIYSCNN